MPGPPAQRPGTSLVPSQATTRPNPGQASAPPVGSIGQGESSTEATTVITQVGPNVDGRSPTLYNGDRRWVKVTMTLQTAGQVVWGVRSELGPLTSGNGTELVTNVPTTVTIAKGTRIYYLASAVNRVVVQIEPLPWLEDILAGIRHLIKSVLGQG